MRIVIQRCLESKVVVEGKTVGEIQKGLNLLVCIEKEDNEETIKKAVHKVGNIRVFEDPETGKMSFNTQAIGGKFLAISQFTLSWRGEKGHRPSFDRSMPPEEANRLFEVFCDQLSEFAPVEKGIFAADMKVKILNDGPVTFTLDF